MAKPQEYLREIAPRIDSIYRGALTDAAERLDALESTANALLHQIDIGDFVDSNGHSAKMLKPVWDLMKLMKREPKAIAAGAAPNKRVIEELEQLKAKLADQTKAADHWMEEACKNHNDLVRANEKLAEFLAQKPVAWLYEVNGRIKLETKRLDNYYWMGEGDSWVKGKPLILAAGAALKEPS